MVKGDKDQAVLASMKLSNHSTKHSDVLEVSSKGKDCDLKLSSRLLMSMAPPLMWFWPLNAKNVFSFCELICFAHVIQCKFWSLELQLFVDLPENIGSKKWMLKINIIWLKEESNYKPTQNDLQVYNHKCYYF